MYFWLWEEELWSFSGSIGNGMEAVREEGHLWMPGSLWKPKKYTALACFTTQYGIPFLLERVLYHGCVCGGGGLLKCRAESPFEEVTGS